MSVHVIYYSNGAKMMRPVGNREEYMALRDSNQNRRAEKRHMVQMNYSCLPNDDGTLRGSTRMSNSVGMDVDFAEGQVPEGVEEMILSMADQLGLLMLERSASKGYHIAFRRRTNLSQEENLQWASRLLGVAYDQGAKDITRVFYTPADKLVYLHDDLFIQDAVKCSELSGKSPEGAVKCYSQAHQASQSELSGKSPEDAVKCYSQAHQASQSELSGKSPEAPAQTPCHAEPAEASFTAPAPSRLEDDISITPYIPDVRGTESPEAGVWKTLPDSTAPAQSPINPPPFKGGREGLLTYGGISYAEIIAKYWEMFNDGKLPVEGDRNVKTYELAMTLRPICDYSLEQMMAVIPRYDGFDEEEWRRTLENALKEPRKGMPYRLRQVLAALKKDNGVKAAGGTVSTPPPMPKRLPRLVQLLTKNVPSYYRPAVASAVFPALATHLHGVRFRYWDNVEHEATFMNVLIGRQSIGKGCIKKPIEYITADIVERDNASRAREAEWKRLNPTSKTKPKDPRPTDICIQMLIDNLTDAVFNQRIVDVNQNGQRYVYTIVDEIESLKKVTSKGTIDEVSLLIRKAFDNSLAGQERVGPDSVSGIAPLRWNWNASTTPPNARKFFFRAVNDGTISRLDVSTIMMPNNRSAKEDANYGNDEAPIMGIYDEQFAQELKPYIDRLESASGLIECPQAERLSLKLRQENLDTARLYDSEAYLVLSYRANVIAWLKGMLLYIAQGYQWDKSIADFVRWSEQYNLWCKLLYFGKQLEAELREEENIQSTSGPQNLLNLLPDEFTEEQYRQMRLTQGKTSDGASTLRVWINRGHIYLDDITGSYHKTEKYLKRKKI